jgi:3-phenylpropionate/trans-cinnamate dioxygenase ferredoxin reductase subunit
MADSRTFVIVGASLAGAKAAETLRQEGFEGRVVLIGDEPERPYERPPLSKGFLRGESKVDEAFVHEESFYADKGIELLLSTRAERIDVPRAKVVLADGAEVPYDSLLLTTGSTPRRPNLPGVELDGVHFLRTLADSRRLRKAISSASRVVVIGAGWIGCEVAASARRMGVAAAMVDVSSLPLERVLGPQLGAFYRDVHADHGVELHLGTGVEAIRGGDAVAEVVLSDGTRLEADVAVVGVGVVPRVELAQAAGIDIDNGIPTDEYLATGLPGVFAAGDVANAWHPVLGRRVRLEHWSSALNQGPVAARNMLGERVAYEKIPYFFSDQYDVGMEYTGLATDVEQVVFRGDPGTREFIAFWLEDGCVAAGMNVNVWDVADTVADLVRSKRQVDPGRLTDPSTELGSLTKS